MTNLRLPFLISSIFFLVTVFALFSGLSVSEARPHRGMVEEEVPELPGPEEPEIPEQPVVPEEPEEPVVPEEPEEPLIPDLPFPELPKFELPPFFSGFPFSGGWLQKPETSKLTAEAAPEKQPIPSKESQLNGSDTKP